MDLYNMMFNISNNDIKSVINEEINNVYKEVTETDRMCIVFSNLLYNRLNDRHVLSKIISTSELGLGYRHDFVIVKDNYKYYLVDGTYEQFLNKGTKLNQELLDNKYIEIDNDILIDYLNSIPYCDKIGYLDIDDIFLPRSRKK